MLYGEINKSKKNINLPYYIPMTSGEKLLVLSKIIEKIKLNISNKDFNIIDIATIISDLNCDIIKTSLERI
jgi:hypothetical protein